MLRGQYGSSKFWSTKLIWGLKGRVRRSKQLSNASCTNARSGRSLTSNTSYPANWKSECSKMLWSFWKKGPDILICTKFVDCCIKANSLSKGKSYFYIQNRSDLSRAQSWVTVLNVLTVVVPEEEWKRSFVVGIVKKTSVTEKVPVVMSTFKWTWWQLESQYRQAESLSNT